jgi:hypothetical protein
MASGPAGTRRTGTSPSAAFSTSIVNPSRPDIDDGLWPRTLSPRFSAIAGTASDASSISTAEPSWPKTASTFPNCTAMTSGVSGSCWMSKKPRVVCTPCQPSSTSKVIRGSNPLWV